MIATFDRIRRWGRQVHWVAWVILGVGLSATAAGSYVAERYSREEARSELEGETNRIALQISDRLKAYEQVLRGGASIFDLLGSVSRDQWRSYVAGIEIDKNLPGVQGVGFAEVVPGEKLAEFTARVRSEGFPSFEVRPAGVRPVYAVVVYLEPFDWRNRRAFGFDMLSEPVRRAAMLRAWRSGEPAISGKVTLVQETETDPQAGFLMYLPVYRAGPAPASVHLRPDRLLGFVYAPFRMKDFLGASLGPVMRQFRLRVYDGTEPVDSALMLDSAPDTAAPRSARSGLTLLGPPLSYTMNLDLPAHQWTLRFDPLPGFLAEADRSDALYILFAGTIISLLLLLITWRVMRSSEQLRKKEADLRYLFEKNPSVMWVYDRDSLEFLEVNDAALALYGYARDEFKRMRISDIRPAEDLPRLIERVRQESPNLRVSSGWRHLTKDGRLLDVEIGSYRLAFAGRDAALVVARDVTEQRRAAAALAESEQRFRNMANSMPALLWLYNPTGEAVFVNTPWLDYTGRTLEEELGQGWLDCVHPDDVSSAKALTDNAIKLRGPMTLQYRLRRADGAYRWFLDRGLPRFAADGMYLGSIGVLIDITDLRNAQMQLQQAMKMEAVGRLTGGIAHDFNNLLTVIVGNAEALLDFHEAGEEGQTIAKTIVNASMRAADLVRRLLAFSRRQQLEPRLLDVNALVSGMEPLLRRTLGEDIDIQFDAGADLWPTFADPGQLETSLLNLAVNARDAMPAGGKITIETANDVLDEHYAATNEDVRPGDYVRISLSDTGTGMSPEILERAFEPFFTTKEVGRGTGLGLSMVYGFIKQSGGHVKAYSEVGHGTVIKLYLPRAAESRAAADERNKPAEGMPTGSETILAVEDEPLVRLHVEQQLRALGYHVIVAEDGPSALARLAQIGGVHLLFTDMIMPGGMTGGELAEQARKLHPGLKVLFTTGYAASAIQHQGRLHESVSLLSKPYRMHELAAKVRQALDSGGPT